MPYNLEGSSQPKKKIHKNKWSLNINNDENKALVPVKQFSQRQAFINDIVNEEFQDMNLGRAIFKNRKSKHEGKSKKKKSNSQIEASAEKNQETDFIWVYLVFLPTVRVESAAQNWCK